VKHFLPGDAHHITQPQHDGRGAILAMKRALDQSGLNANEIDYVNAHATSTPLGKYSQSPAKDIWLDTLASEDFCLICIGDMFWIVSCTKLP